VVQLFKGAEVNAQGGDAYAAIRFEFVDGFGALSAWFRYIRTVSGVVGAGPSGITSV